MAKSARAWISRGDGGTLELDEVLIPEPGPYDAVVRVLACGLCHSDVNTLRRVNPTPIQTVLGHEAAVVVETVGSAVRQLVPGDYGIVAWRAPCGVCRSCLRGEPVFCRSSLTASRHVQSSDGAEIASMLGIGGFAELAIVAAAQVVPVDRAVRPEVAGLIGCGVMTGFGAAAYTGAVRRGDSVAVFGCGGVGDAAIAASSLAGASMVIAVDLKSQKLKWAEHFGATHLLNAAEVDVLEEVLGLTEGIGVDVAIDAVGLPETYLQALRARGAQGMLVQVGIPTVPTMSVTLALRDLFGQRGAVLSSHYGDCLPTRDFPQLADLYLQGKLDLDAFVSETISLEDLPDAIGRLERGEVLRSVVVF